MLLLFITQSCTKENESNKFESDFVFTYISACGWCGGSYELTIVNNLASFEYYAVCDNKPRSFEKELSNYEIDNLNLSELYDEIKLLEIDNCGVCVDGCDESIIFIEDGNKYSIRFRNEENVAHILDNISKIRDLFQNINNESLKE